MASRGTLAALALALLSIQPTTASSAIVQKWQTPGGTGYVLYSQVGDLNSDGTFDLLTGEFQAGGVVKLALRSGATGAILAQTAGTYQPQTFWIGNLEPTNDDNEIMFSDTPTAKLNCLQYTTGNSTLAVRWSYVPTPSGVPTKWNFIDLDGNGYLSFVFKDETGGSNKYFVRDYNGVLVSTIDLAATAPSGAGWNSSLYADDYDQDGRQEILIDYRYSGSPNQDVFYVYESNAPEPGAPADAARESRPMSHALPAVRRIEQVNGIWAEAGHTEIGSSTAPRMVELP